MNTWSSLNPDRLHVMRRFAVLLAFLLLAAQTASATHRHADDSLPTGHQAQVCDFCAGFQAAAPAPDIAAPMQHSSPALTLTAAADPLRLPAPRVAAHRSRAPPAFRSI